jgi:spore cortex formation protein SpoVR/YcgB (stage V sporulation)
MAISDREYIFNYLALHGRDETVVFIDGCISYLNNIKEEVKKIPDPPKGIIND